ncbi:alpha-amylase family glycosyl hydrolase [Asaia platycodi]|uniref:alpha-amylase family glycosyl hydrolase n=1 Tax=Asaia platycodi TaxID=610243 RepID=UPI0006886EBC|nr:alpha-amylase family glycosyl hydrolase [Asaia platycodi]
MNPLPFTATLRLQFHREFTFDQAIPLVPYFRKLGISHLYASPLLASTPGSMHGYDTIDCHRIDPERGGIEGLRRLVTRLRQEGMGLILDIVPNHMGVGPDNIWWMDVLRLGERSPMRSISTSTGVLQIEACITRYSCLFSARLWGTSSTPAN